MKGNSKRWVRTTKEFKRQYALGVSHATIDLVLRGFSYVELPMPDRFRISRKRVWFVKDLKSWYNQPLNWHTVATCTRATDEELYTKLVEWMLANDMLGVMSKKKK